MEKIRLCILCGGQSAEHEVSLQSTLNVVAAVDPAKFEIILVGIDKQGQWHLHDPADFLTNVHDPARTALSRPGPRVALVCVEGHGCLMPLNGAAGQSGPGQSPSLSAPLPVDVAFPVLHGTYGEDGAIQGMLKMVNIACVGSDISSSANCMDKETAKRLLMDVGIPVAPMRVLTANAKTALTPRELVHDLGLPLFVKPARLGSSVGISKVEQIEDVAAALDLAFLYDTKVLIEKAIPGREIECSVLGNRQPRASVLGEVIAVGGFYSYENKYLRDDGAELKVPVDLDEDVARTVQKLALAAFQTLGCSGMARVDFFVQPDGKVVLNELNTIPGFTRISMYPRLWQATGMTYPQLIEKLIRLALERRHEEKSLLTDFQAGPSLGTPD